MELRCTNRTYFLQGMLHIYCTILRRSRRSMKILLTYQECLFERSVEVWKWRDWKEKWQSGRLWWFRKPLWPQGHRGFESHFLRQSICLWPVRLSVRTPEMSSQRTCNLVRGVRFPYWLPSRFPETYEFCYSQVNLFAFKQNENMYIEYREVINRAGDGKMLLLFTRVGVL